MNIKFFLFKLRATVVGSPPDGGREGKMKIGKKSARRDRVPEIGIAVETSDHWSFLEEIEAPMWADLKLEAEKGSQDTDEEWFFISHPVHQLSSRFLKSSIHDKTQNKTKVWCSPCLPESVSRSRGKHYNSEKSSRKKLDVSPSNRHPIRKFTGSEAKISFQRNDDPAKATKSVRNSSSQTKSMSRSDSHKANSSISLRNMSLKNSSISATETVDLKPISRVHVTPGRATEIKKPTKSTNNKPSKIIKGRVDGSSDALKRPGGKDKPSKPNTKVKADSKVFDSNRLRKPLASLNGVTVNKKLIEIQRKDTIPEKNSCSNVRKEEIPNKRNIVTKGKMTHGVKDAIIPTAPRKIALAKYMR
ncbi:uncharacterized protein LOC144707733 [Wolffia australiana]